MADLVIEKVNEVYLKIETEPHVEYELRDRFTFEVPNMKFMPQYRKRHWNGEIHLFDIRTKRIYVGLLDKVIAFCEKAGYTYKFEPNKFYGLPFEVNEMVSPEGVKDFMASITPLKPRDYQIEAVSDALRYNRKLLISPTASGKSFMIYSIVRASHWYEHRFVFDKNMDLEEYWNFKTKFKRKVTSKYLSCFLF